jgi:hypothetical protein
MTPKNFSAEVLIRTGKSLEDCKADFQKKALKFENVELRGLQQLLQQGRIDGHYYGATSSDCGCFVGTLEYLYFERLSRLDFPVERDYHSPVEKFFCWIREGDTPSSNPYVVTALEWLDEIFDMRTESLL